MCFEHFAVNGPIAKETLEAKERENLSWDELRRDANIFWFVKGCTQIEIFKVNCRKVRVLRDHDIKQDLNGFQVRCYGRCVAVVS